MKVTPTAPASLTVPGVPGTTRKGQAFYTAMVPEF